MTRSDQILDILFSSTGWSHAQWNDFQQIWNLVIWKAEWSFGLNIEKESERGRERDKEHEMNKDGDRAWNSQRKTKEKFKQCEISFHGWRFKWNLKRKIVWGSQRMQVPTTFGNDELNGLDLFSYIIDLLWKKYQPIPLKFKWVAVSRLIYARPRRAFPTVPFKYASVRLKWIICIKAKIFIR